MCVPARVEFRRARERSATVQTNSILRTSFTVSSTLFLFSAAASAQGPVFQSPGISTYSQRGQVNRFSNDFNPAIGGVIDAAFGYVDQGDDRWDPAIRLVELNVSAFIDPSLWAYVVLTAEGDSEAPEVEEAAAEYIGFDSNFTVKAGRFFVDFGKQMQTHVEELRTFDRALVLREYLGEELAGDGVQFDWWTALGDKTPFRVSVGLFGSLVGEAEEAEAGAAEPFGGAREELSDLALTARATVMHELSPSSTLQAGASLRSIPTLGFADPDGVESEVDGFDDNVVGLDLTYGWTGETGTRRFLLGGEYLSLDGALSAEVSPGSIDVTEGSASGYVVFADYGWNPNWSAGVQWSEAELRDGATDASELDLYLTWHQTEFRRLRLGTTIADADGADRTSSAYLQFTAFLGSHTHGLNW
jgi:hypothetical protein